MICSGSFLTLSPLGILGAGRGELVGERSLSHEPGSALSPELKLFCRRAGVCVRLRLLQKLPLHLLS